MDEIEKLKLRVQGFRDDLIKIAEAGCEGVGEMCEDDLGDELESYCLPCRAQHLLTRDDERVKLFQ